MRRPAPSGVSCARRIILRHRSHLGCKDEAFTTTKAFYMPRRGFRYHSHWATTRLPVSWRVSEKVLDSAKSRSTSQVMGTQKHPFPVVHRPEYFPASPPSQRSPKTYLPGAIAQHRAEEQGRLVYEFVFSGRCHDRDAAQEGHRQAATFHGSLRRRARGAILVPKVSSSSSVRSTSLRSSHVQRRLRRLEGSSWQLACGRRGLDLHAQDA